MNDFPQNLTVLLEPTAECNLRCRHCYHAKTDYVKNRMSIPTLNKFLKCVAGYYRDVKIIWHGGEPILMGYDFFENAYALFKRFSAEYNIRFKFGIQTNGTLLNDNLIDLFVKTNTHISISFDGVFNDVLRQGTKEVECVISKLKNRRVEFSCISTISSANVRHIKEMYEFFKGLAISVKFNPIYSDGAATENNDFLISKEDWAHNFVELFEYWYNDADCNIRFISCMEVLRKYLISYYGCLGGICLYRYLAVDSYGDLYPCGRLISDDFRLANVDALTDIREAFISPKYSELSRVASIRAEKCKSCTWFSRCHSGCNASANLGGDLATAYPFDCYFTQYVFGKLEKILSNNKAINPYAKELITLLQGE